MSAPTEGKREGSLQAPTRHPLDWKNPEFYNEESLFKELERVYDICHGCRRCVSLCQSFPTLFDLVDESPTLEVDGIKKEDYWKVVDHCYLCDLCFMTKCPYVPPHEWNLDFPHLMLRAKAVKYQKGDIKLRDRLLTSTDTVGKLAGIPIVVQTVNASNKTKVLRTALDKVAFLPFGLIIDKWRWGVFSGEISPDEYNRAWWELKLRYQGVAPPSPRGEKLFDPGAKYHVPGNTPYMRYFLADILQFQFHRALAGIAGAEGPLHRASIYESQAAGAKLDAMMRMGLRQPWPDALEALTGEREMDATAILDYFAPLARWLDERNAGRTCGW